MPGESELYAGRLQLADSGISVKYGQKNTWETMIREEVSKMPSSTEGMLDVAKTIQGI